MSRPSKTEQAELEALESMAALLASIRQCNRVLALRIRQAERRALGHEYILAVLGPSHDELDSISASADGIRQLLRELLDTRQQERILKNGGDPAPKGQA